MAGIYRWANQLGSDDFPSEDDFDTFYAKHHQLLNQDAWKQYYSLRFITQATSARFYRLPNLQDLPDFDALTLPREKAGGVGHFSKLPRWANHVARTYRRPKTLPRAKLTRIAVSTLQETILRQQQDSPDLVQPYSETQVRFWLNHMGMEKPKPEPGTDYEEALWYPDQFGIRVAQGCFDIWEWEKKYSPERWNSVEARATVLEPDVKRPRKDEVMFCGWPDGGVGLQGWWRGWEPEVGSEEELAFLAGVAVEETMRLSDLGKLEYTKLLHILLGVMYAAFEGREDTEELKQGIVGARMIGESRVGQWITEVLKVMELYVQSYDGTWPTTNENRTELLQRILLENGQLFGRWGTTYELGTITNEFEFYLKEKR